jgi:hypothetical protein
MNLKEGVTFVGQLYVAWWMLKLGIVLIIILQIGFPLWNHLYENMGVEINDKEKETWGYTVKYSFKIGSDAIVDREYYNSLKVGDFVKRKELLSHQISGEDNGDHLPNPIFFVIDYCKGLFAELFEGVNAESFKEAKDKLSGNYKAPR